MHRCHVYKQECTITLFNCMVVFRSIFSSWHGPPLYYLHGKNLENKNKMLSVQTMTSAGLNSKNIVNIVVIFNDSVAMNRNYKEFLLG